MPYMFYFVILLIFTIWVFVYQISFDPELFGFRIPIH